MMMKSHHDNTPYNPLVQNPDVSPQGTKLKLRAIEEKYGAEAALATLHYADLFMSLHSREIAQEIRTTLTSLQGASARLSASDDSEDSVHSDVTQAQKVAISLLSLVRNIEAFSSPLHLNIQPASTELLIKEAYQLASEVAFEKGNITSSIEFKFAEGEDIEIRVSPHHLLIALANIIQSVIDFNDEQKGESKVDRTVIITVNASQEVVCIEVSNKSSIDADEAAELPASDFPGFITHDDDVNHGLWTARRIVEVHGGDIRVYGSRGKLVNIRIELPRFA